MKKLITLALLIFGLQSQAQDYFWTLSWDMTTPVSETQDFIGTFNVRGLGLDNRWVYNESYSVGFFMGWHTMYEKKANQVEYRNNGNTVLYGNQFRYINSFPFALTGHYYFNPRSKVSVSAGAGLGPQWLEARKEINLVAIVDKGWRFGFYPEIGIHVPINRNTKLQLDCKYHYILGRDGGPDYTYLNANIGLSWGFF